MAFRFAKPRPICTFDTECFPNYWSIAFKCIKTGQTRRFHMYSDGQDLDRRGIAKILFNWCVVGFNSVKYDMPMVALAMAEGTTCAELKRANDDLILGDLPHWQAYKRWNVSLPDYVDHIDVMEVSPGAAQRLSLKISAARLHSRKIQDLPFEVDYSLQPDDLPVVEIYHDNDLDMTRDMLVELKPQIDLRTEMSIQYDVDLRSKSDAQIAEAVIKHELEGIRGRPIYAPEIEQKTFVYRAPDHLRFESKVMREVLHQCKTLPFTVGAKGVVQMPKFLEDRVISIGTSHYKMGLGGLHSKEESVTHIATNHKKIKDRDVTSYYPWTILSLGLFPRHLGPDFLKVYREIYDRRIAAKKRSQELKGTPGAREWENLAESLKIVLNGTFGKLGSPYSIMYAPELMVQVTLTGQLSILMLIERLEQVGCSVVSANTDGIVTIVPTDNATVFRAVVAEWEWETLYGTEEVEYQALYSRDVNNYLAVPLKGATKTKGAFGACGPGLKGAMGLKKNPNCEIAVEAVTKLLVDGTPIEDTVYACTDIRKFVVVRKVTDGALDQYGDPIGKSVRWTYTTRTRLPFTYAKDGKTVPKSHGARPLMELPPDNELIDDIDFAYYVREAYAILQDIGYGVIDPKLAGRSGYFFGRREKAKNIHYVDAATGVAVCGNERDSIRESWTEFAFVPKEMRMCPKCRKWGEV